MNCEKARDRFSSLWEKELAPLEEKVLQEHLSSCPECRREFEQFEKTMGCLRSVGEAEVPEGFLSELYKKRNEKTGAIPLEKPGGKWFHFPLSFKLPAQAVAMVAVVFLVLYLTRMMPMEGGRLSETEQTSPALSLQEKKEQGLTRSAPPATRTGGEGEERRPDSTLSEPSRSFRQGSPPEQSQGAGRGVEGVTAEEGERRAPGTSPGTPRARDSEQATPAVPAPPGAGVVAYQQAESKVTTREKTPPPEPGKTEKDLAATEKSLVASKPLPEIILKVSDRTKIIPRLRELVKQFGGEAVAVKGNVFIASLPAGSFPEFEKELAEFSIPAKADQLVAKKETAGRMRLEEEGKKKLADERSKGPAGLGADGGSRTIVRIFLVEE